MTDVTRRGFAAGLAAVSALPLRAQSSVWAPVADSARAFDQCHALIIQQNGVEVLAEVFRGPALSRAVPVKSVSKTLVAALTGAAIDRGEIPTSKPLSAIWRRS